MRNEAHNRTRQESSLKPLKGVLFVAVLFSFFFSFDNNGTLKKLRTTKKRTMSLESMFTLSGAAAPGQAIHFHWGWDSGLLERHQVSSLHGATPGAWALFLWAPLEGEHLEPSQAPTSLRPPGLWKPPPLSLQTRARSWKHEETYFGPHRGLFRDRALPRPAGDDTQPSSVTPKRLGVSPQSSLQPS